MILAFLSLSENDSLITLFIDAIELFEILLPLKALTHNLGNTFDQILSPIIIENITVSDAGASNHYMMNFSWPLPSLQQIFKTTTVLFQKFDEIDFTELNREPKSLLILKQTYTKNTQLTNVTIYSNHTESLSTVQNKDTPLITRKITARPHSKWYAVDPRQA